MPLVPPQSQLELIKWRDVVHGPVRCSRTSTRLQAAKIPIGWVLLDNPWEACNGQLTFDPSTFPSPGGLISAVHRLGVKFMLWVSPRATCADGYPGEPLGEPGHEILDLRDPAVVAEYRRRIRRLVALGIDGVKADRGDENDLRAVDPELTNDYPLLFGQAVMGALPKGAAAIFRAATVGSQSVVPGIWAGDQPQDYRRAPQRAIVSAQTAAMSGFPTWGSDVGGYAGPPFDDAELFVRWAQLGAVSPVMEVGGIGGERDAVDARAGGDERPPGRSRSALRALSVPLRAARRAPARDPSARVRLPRRRDVLGVELRVPRRARPARCARRQARERRRASTCRRARGSTCTPARR